MATTVVLQVELSAKPEGEDLEYLKRRFQKFYDGNSSIQYPVTCDSHGYDVFQDEFLEDTWRFQADFACLVELPYGPEDYEPFTEEDAGIELAQYDPSDEAWA